MIRGTKIAKKSAIRLQMITRENSAARALGKDHRPTFILQNRSTSGRPIIESTPETKIYTAMFLKYHRAARNTAVPKIIRKFLRVVFMKRFFLYKPNQKFPNSITIPVFHETVILSAILTFYMSLCLYLSSGMEIEISGEKVNMLNLK